MVHIHAEGPAFFCWIPKLFGKRVICTIHGLDWDREKWRGSVASKFIRGGEKNAVKYADEIIQALLEANGLAAGKDHQFKGRYEAEKNAVIISLENDEREC